MSNPEIFISQTKNNNLFSFSVRIFILFISCFFNPNQILAHEYFSDSSLKDIDRQEKDFVSDSLEIVNLLEDAETLKNKNLEEALEAFQNAYLLSQKSGSNRLMAESLNRLGATAMNAGMLNLSVDYFLRLKKLGQSENNLSFIGNAEYNIGSIQVILEEYENAKISLKSSVTTLTKYYESVGRVLPHRILINLNNNLGICEMGLGNNSDAINLFSEAIKIAERNSSIEYLEYYLALLNLADLYVELDSVGAAEGQLLKVETQRGDTNNKIIEINSLKINGKIFLKKGEFKKAVDSFRNAFTLVENQKNYSGLKHITSDLSVAYEKLENFDSAFYFKNLSQEFEDEIQLNNASKQIMRSRLLEGFNSQKNEIEASYRIKLRLTILLIIFVIILSAIIGYFLFKKSTSLNSFAGFNWVFPNRKSLNDELGDTEKLNRAGDGAFNGKKKSDQGSFLLNPSKERESLSSIFADLDNGKNKKIWKEFEIRLDKIDYQFYEKLISEYPELTMNERRLAAFLKLQFSTKEISLMTGQSIRSIEVARSRLRKKLSMTNLNESLYDFFLKF